MALALPLFHTYARLPDRFFARVAPTPVAAPQLVALNRPLAAELGFDAEALASPAGAAVFSGQAAPDGAEPIAMAYAGHQFGNFVPQLGDGRAILLGEAIDLAGTRRDIQLKGAGLTPFSRGGDGRAAIGPMLREYIVGEAMHALGIATTRILAVALTGEHVWRETVLPGAVATRVARSHLRVGTFQFFAARGDVDALRALVDYAIARHYPTAADAENPPLAFLSAVIGAQADLIARWLGVGFVHGVMNTDNMAISGETIDYGPCAFLENYHPATVFSSIDHAGRYAYGAQPRIAHWNLARLAETLIPLLSANEDAGLTLAEEALEDFPPTFEAAFVRVAREKLGLARVEEGDLDLFQALLVEMAEGEADFTLTFRRLADLAEDQADASARELFKDSAGFDSWVSRWRDRLAREGAFGVDIAARLRRANPIYVARNHLVEAALEAATTRMDFSPFERLVEAVSRPFEERAGLESYAMPARPEERVERTFCGT